MQVRGVRDESELRGRNDVEGSQTESLITILLCVVFSLFILRGRFSSFPILYLKFSLMVKYLGSC